MSETLRKSAVAGTADEVRRRHRDEILQAVDRLMRDKGFAATRMRDAADACGCSVGNLYNYFPNKEAILSELIERETEKFVQLLTRKLASHDGFDSFMERMSPVVDLFLEEGTARLLVSLYNEGLSNRTVREILIRAHARTCTSILQHILQNHKAETFDGRRLALARQRISSVVFMLQSLCHMALFDPHCDKALAKQVMIERLYSIRQSEHWDLEPIKTACCNRYAVFFRSKKKTSLLS